MSVIRFALLLLLVPVPLSAQVAAPGKFQGSTFVHSGHGIRLKLPKNFTRLPVEKDRYHVLGHFLSLKSYPLSGGGRRRGSRDYRPAFRVLYFPPPPKQKADAPKSTLWPRLRYKDYKEYLQRNLSGTLTIKDDKPVKVGSMKCETIRVRRVRRSRQTTRLHAWVFTRDQERFVVEVIFAEEHADKLEQPFLSAMKSFRFLKKRDAAAIPEPLPEPLWRQDPVRWQKLPARQRVDQRRQHQTALHDKARREVLPGWRVKETDAGLILSDAPERYLANASKAAAACRTFLQEHFGDISDEVVRRPVIRIFKERSDYTYYRSRSRQDSHYVPNIDEVCLYADESGQKIAQLGDLHAGLFHQFLNDKHEHLHRHMPAWIDQGVRQYLRLSRPKGNKLSFEASQGERDLINRNRRDKQLLSAKALVHHDNGGLNEGDRSLRYQRGRLIRFFLGRKEDWATGLLGSYAKAVKTAQKDNYLKARHPGAGTVDTKVAEEARKKRDVVRTKLREAVNAALMDWPADLNRKIQKIFVRFNTQI